MTRDLSDVAILFDLDGTLVDTAPDLVDAVNVIVTARGHPPVPEAAIRPLIGYGARAMIEAALERIGEPVDTDELDRLHAGYLAHYEGRIARLSRPFPGLAEALDTLSAAGARFAVCTNKTSRLARLLLEALSLTDRFGAIAGPDTYGSAKPAPAMLERTMAAIGARPGRTVFVGDSRIDVEAARNAGIPVVGATFGYTDTPMEALAPDVLLSGYPELPAAVNTLLARAA